MRRFPQWLLTGCLPVFAAHAQFIQTGAGPFNYADPANWVGGNVNGVFNRTLTADQTVLIDPSSVPGLNVRFGGLFTLTLRGTTAAPASMTLTGDLVFDSVSGGRSLAIGTPGGDGALIVRAGTVDQKFEVGPADTLTLWNGVQDHGFTKTGSGTMVLGGASSFSEVLNVNAGTLRLAAGATISPNADVVLKPGARFEFDGATQTIGSLSGDAGSVAALGGGTLIFSSNFYSSFFDGVITGSGGITMNGPRLSRIELGGQNIYTGATTISGGTISLGRGGHLSPATTLQFTGISSFDLAGASQTVANLVGDSGGSITSVDKSGTLTIGAGNGTFAGTIAASLGSTAIVKNGAGTTTVLSGNNDYTGGTTLKAGTIRAASLTALGTGPVTFDGGTLQAGINFDTPGSVLLKAGGGTVDTNGFSASFSSLVSGTGALVKTGAGTFILNDFAQPNTFSGGLTIKAGTVLATYDTALGAPANPVFLDGGTLSMQDHFPAEGLLERGITISPTGGGLGGEYVMTASGVVSGPGALRVEVPKTVTLTAQNTYQGGTVVGPTGSLQITGTNRGLGTGPVSVQAGGVLALSAETNLAPGVRVSLVPGAMLAVLNTAILPANVIDSDPAKTTGGVLGLGAASYDQPLDMAAIGNGRLFLGASGTAAYTAATLGAGIENVHRLGGASASRGVSTITFGGLNLLTGTSSVVIGPTGSIANGTVALLNANDYTGGTTLASGTLAIGNNLALGNGPLRIDGGTLKTQGAEITLPNSVTAFGDFALSGSAFFPITFGTTVDLRASARVVSVEGFAVFAGTVRDGGLVKDGPGTLTLAAANSYAGGTTIRLGTLRSSAVGALGSGPITIGGDPLLIDPPKLVLVTAVQNLANPIALTASAAIELDSASTISAPISATTVGAKTLTLQGFAPNAAITGQIANGAGVLALDKTDIGFITLSGNNSYSGGTILSAGRLTVSADANLGAVPAVRATNLTFTRGTLRYGAAFALNPNRTLLLNSTATTPPTIDTNGFDVTIASGITGAGRLVKGGAGMLTLTAGNSFTGGTTISAGGVLYSSLSTLGSGTITLANGTIAAFGFAVQQSYLDKFSKTSDAVVALAANTGAPLNFAGANWRLGAVGAATFSGSLTPNGSTFRLGGGGGTLTISTGTLSGPRSLDLDGSGTNTGTVLLNAISNYSGATNIATGTLKLGPSSAIPNTPSIALGGTARFDVTSLTNGFALGAGKTILGSGAVTGRFTTDAGGFVSPGTAAAPFAKLTFDDLILKGRYAADIDASGAHDLLAILGNLDLGSDADFLDVKYTVPSGGEYVLATYAGTLTGQFDNISLPPNYAIDYGTGSNSQIRLIPEPAAIALLLAGSLSPLSFRRRR